MCMSLVSLIVTGTQEGDISCAGHDCLPPHLVRQVDVKRRLEAAAAGRHLVRKREGVCDGGVMCSLLLQCSCGS